MIGAYIAFAVYGAAVAWDAYCTNKIMKTNPKGELNPAVKAIAAKNGALAGTLGGVVGPALILGLIGLRFHPLLYLLTGARAAYGYLQFLSFKRGLI